MAATIKDVARLAHTSKSTVSRYLNGTAVHPDVAAAIRKAVTDLNYHPNMNARRLVMERTQVIGIVVDDISNRFYSQIFKGIREMLNAEGYDYVFYTWTRAHERELDFLRLLYEEQVDGLIFMSFVYRHREDVEAMRESPFPIVLIGHNADVSISTVDVDNKAGVMETVQYLHRIGHRRIAFISGPEEAGASRARTSGYLTALEDLAIEGSPALMQMSDWTHEGGYHAMKHLLRLGGFTAVIASNDESAIGAMTCMQEQGYAIPRDFSVVGFDDIDISRWIFPALTTVRQPFENIGQTAAQLLMRGIKATLADPPPSMLLKPELIIRNSTGRPR